MKTQMLGMEHVIPEMNHNELAGWAGGKRRIRCCVFQIDYEHPRSAVRMDITKEIVQKHTKSILEFKAKGESLLHTFYHILLGDWISVYLAELYKVDAVEVKVIDYLKAELAKI